MIKTSNFEGISLFEKKFGLQMSSKITKQEKQTTLNKINIFLSKLHDICPKDLYNNIINNSPKPYPSSTIIIKLNSQKHSLYSRRFDTSMLCYDVRNCDCCGKICINHYDNLLERENIIKRSHLTRKNIKFGNFIVLKLVVVNNFIVLKTHLKCIISVYITMAKVHGNS